MEGNATFSANPLKDHDYASSFQSDPNSHQDHSYATSSNMPLTDHTYADLHNVSDVTHDHTYSKNAKPLRTFTLQEAELLERNWHEDPILSHEISNLFYRLITGFAFAGSCLDVSYTVVNEEFLVSMGNFRSDIEKLRQVYKTEILHQLSFSERFKVNVGMHAVFLNTSEQDSFGNDVQIHHHPWLKAISCDRGSDIDTIVTDIIEKLILRISESEKGPSGLVYYRFLSTTLSFSIYNLQYGGHLNQYFELPYDIRKRKAIDPVYRSQSVNNTDGNCFKLTIAHFFKEVFKGSVAPSIREEHMKENMTLKDIAIFEKYHPEIRINVIAMEMKHDTEQVDHFTVIYKSKNELTCMDECQISLLLHNDHYFLITDLGKLICSKSRKGFGGGSKHFCFNCLTAFDRRLRLEKHQEICLPFGQCIPTFPKDHLEFTNYEMTLDLPVICYFDFETTHSHIEEGENEKGLHTTRVNELKPIKVGMKIYFAKRECLENDQELRDLEKVVIFTGDNCVEDFLIHLKNVSFLIRQKIETIPMKMTQEDRKAFKEATMCGLCKKSYINDLDANNQIKDKSLIPCRHHCHLTVSWFGAMGK